ncbi:insulinase family protein [Alkalihalobacillus sp. MEB130]|uniref:EF-P 5-aminopentanol modification-associated protein YfmF n=1 Tax=Alkalihalobacillus sp. MEB130 TaxID=2976704 RepID=UPI0028E04E18|nr:pitrilysin family protein [Alkalihalobacillus sp. MEB130]MDT8858964.1 insulinase family protein [Alkalihalobacillus sp. MEB130]
MYTNKYKTNSLILMIKAPLTKETVAMRALLPHILQNGTANSPSRKQLRERLDDMYGAMLATDVQKKGEEHVISIRLDVANERYLSDTTPLFDNAISLLAEVIFQPQLENGTFVTSVVESEKRSLKQRIQSVYDDKMRYANVRVTEEMCKGEPFALTAFGTEEEVEAITAESIFSYYQDLLKSNQFDLYIVGAIEGTEVIQKVEEKFNSLSERKVAPFETSQSPEVKEVNVVNDEQDVKQGKLHMGFRTYTTYADDDYVAMQVCNGLYGAFSHSKLFINVREKESLAYYAASRFESHKGIMMVMSGIEFSKYDRAVEIIKEQFEAMKQGDFTEAEVEQTKAMLKNQLLETADVARGLVELSYHQVVSGKNRSIEQWMQQIDKVTKEDIVRVAKKVKLDTIYFLKGKEESQ